MEGSGPTMIGELLTTDDDVWSLGHGPPFTITLADKTPSDINTLVAVKFIPGKQFL